MYFADEVSMRLLEMVYGIAWSDFVLKFHGFAMVGIKGMCIPIWLNTCWTDRGFV
jgi:hypothetical protein